MDGSLLDAIQGFKKGGLKKANTVVKSARTGGRVVGEAAPAEPEPQPAYSGGGGGGGGGMMAAILAQRAKMKGGGGGGGGGAAARPKPQPKPKPKPKPAPAKPARPSTHTTTSSAPSAAAAPPAPIYKASYFKLSPQQQWDTVGRADVQRAFVPSLQHQCLVIKKEGTAQVLLHSKVLAPTAYTKQQPNFIVWVEETNNTYVGLLFDDVPSCTAVLKQVDAVQGKLRVDFEKKQAAAPAPVRKSAAPPAPAPPPARGSAAARPSASASASASARPSASASAGAASKVNARAEISALRRTLQQALKDLDALEAKLA